MQQIGGANTRLVGITSGGAWLAERLQKDMNLPVQAGKISSVMHRDDFAQRGLSSGGQTVLPFDVNGADILILDDVLFTGRTLRAVINELFDYGRPASIQLAVLADRGRRDPQLQSGGGQTGMAGQDGEEQKVRCVFHSYQLLTNELLLQLLMQFSAPNTMGTP